MKTLLAVKNISKTRPIRVLLAEDEHIYQSIIEKYIHDFDMQLTIVDDGQKCLDTLEKQHYDVILMDIIMPDINGFQATRELSKDAATKDIPIIVVTTKDQETDRVWGMRQGASEFLVKPVDEKALANAIRNFIPAA